MNHNEAFQKLADDARTRIAEIAPGEVRAADSPPPVVIDVREHNEFIQEHIPGAVHLSRGILEQRVAEVAPDPAAPIICYCGAGNRGALAADSLQKMGYTNVSSIKGGLNAWKAKNLGTES